jgi:hypothetical protein
MVNAPDLAQDGITETSELADGVGVELLPNGKAEGKGHGRLGHVEPGQPREVTLYVEPS